MALDDFGLRLGPLQRASLKQDTMVGRTRTRMRSQRMTEAKPLPVNKEVRQALSELTGNLEWLKRAAMTTGLMSRLPDDFNDRVLEAIRELVDIAQLEDR
jgi:hypothetical protein